VRDSGDHVESTTGDVTGSWIACLRSHPGPSTFAILSFGAAAIHFAVSPEHFGEWAPYGVAFACLAWFQLLWAAAYLARPARRWASAAAAVNAGAVIVWVWSRTIGLPIGPDPGSTEPVGFADALSSGFEALLVLGLLAGGTPLAARVARQPARWGAAVVLVTFTVVALTLVALIVLAPQAMSMG
jgi:hypothetical protein